MRVLVIEDDLELNKQLVEALENDHYSVDKAFDGEEGQFLGETETYDAIILDLGLPKLNGMSVLEAWRDLDAESPVKNVPVLVLTARNKWSEKVEVFDKGADDYVTKPFHIEEILARLRAIIRRHSGHSSAQITCGPVILDTRSSRVTLNGKFVDLTAHEFKLFAFMMHNPDEVFSRTELSEHIYDLQNDPDSLKDSNTIDVFIARLRKKLPGVNIDTIRGRGYRLSLPSAELSPNDSK